MFDKAKILARLQNGETLEDIAKEMTDALNDADQAFQESETKRLEEEKRASEQKRVHAAKSAAVDMMLDAVCDYLVAAGEDKLLDEFQEVDTEKVIDLLDGTIEMAKSLEKLKGLEFPLMEFHKAATINPRVQKIVVNENSADQVLGDFLKKFGL